MDACFSRVLIASIRDLVYPVQDPVEAPIKAYYTFYPEFSYQSDGGAVGETEALFRVAFEGAPGAIKDLFLDGQYGDEFGVIYFQYKVPQVDC